MLETQVPSCPSLIFFIKTYKQSRKTVDFLGNVEKKETRHHVQWYFTAGTRNRTAHSIIMTQNRLQNDNLRDRIGRIEFIEFSAKGENLNYKEVILTKGLA